MISLKFYEAWLVPYQYRKCKYFRLASFENSYLAFLCSRYNLTNHVKNVLSCDCILINCNFLVCRNRPETNMHFSMNSSNFLYKCTKAIAINYFDLRNVIRIYHTIHDNTYDASQILKLKDRDLEIFVSIILYKRKNCCKKMIFSWKKLLIILRCAGRCHFLLKFCQV